LLCKKGLLFHFSKSLQLEILSQNCAASASTCSTMVAGTAGEFYICKFKKLKAKKDTIECNLSLARFG
jgi:hypothetical protein